MSAVPRIGDKWADDDMALPDMESKEYFHHLLQVRTALPLCDGRMQKIAPGRNLSERCQKGHVLPPADSAEEVKPLRTTK